LSSHLAGDNPFATPPYPLGFFTQRLHISGQHSPQPPSVLHLNSFSARTDIAALTPISPFLTSPAKHDRSLTFRNFLHTFMTYNTENPTPVPQLIVLNVDANLPVVAAKRVAK
jgi:hypothetical protein